MYKGGLDKINITP